MSGPFITGTAISFDTTYTATSAPFNNLTISDAIATDTVTITITPSSGTPGATGFLSLNGQPVGTTYSLPVSQLANLKLLTFTPNGGNGIANISIAVTRDGMRSPVAVASEPVIISCFTPGTMIACPTGERAVETLSAGDEVVTVSGKTETIRFVGRRNMQLASCRHHAPVCIPAGALGDGMPTRMLMISPDHAVMMEGYLIPARSLLGGCITQDGSDEVTYYHIQLDRHDVISANGAPCETLLETDDHSMFDNSDEAVHSDAFLEPVLPRLTQGPVVEAVRRAIEARLSQTV